MLTITVILFLFCYDFIRCDGQSYCYMEDTNPYQYFGTKTTYALVRTSDMEIPPPNSCKPIYIWALIRHGTRYSSQADLKKSSELQSQILSNHETEKRGSLCFKDLKNLKQWTGQGYGKSTDDLAPHGKAELGDLGKRLVSKFTELIGNISNNIYFQTTSKRRTKDSAAAFIEGMYGIDRGMNVNITSYENVFRFLELSENYQREVAQNNATFKEKELFLKSKYMQSLMKEVSDRLGFNEILPEKTIRHLYFTCAFENAWNPNSNPAFCAAFTKQHLQVLEYFYFDLPDYYEVGYGSPYNIKMHSPVIEDLLSKMTTASESHDGIPKAHFYFSHSAILTHTIAKLGLYRDEEPLLHNNYGWRKHKPKWSMHTLSPFSGNLMAVLHICDDKASWFNETYQVALYHNENLIRMPECPTQLCPLSQFLNFVRSNNKENKEGETSSAQGLSEIAARSLYWTVFSFLVLIGTHHHHHHHYRHFV